MCPSYQAEELLLLDAKSKGGGSLPRESLALSLLCRYPLRALSTPKGRREPSSSPGWPALGLSDDGCVVIGHCHGKKVGVCGEGKAVCPFSSFKNLVKLRAKLISALGQFVLQKTALRHLRGGGNLFDVLARPPKQLL